MVLEEFKVSVISLIKDDIDTWFKLDQPKVVEEEETKDSQEETKQDKAAVRVAAKLSLSEVEKLAQNVLLLSKQKKELEAAMKVAQQNVTLARSKHDQETSAAMSLKSQLGTGQMAASLQQRRQLLGAGGSSPGGAPKGPCGRMVAAIKSYCTSRRLELIKNVAMFAGSVYFFHAHGDEYFSSLNNF